MPTPVERQTQFDREQLRLGEDSSGVRLFMPRHYAKKRVTFIKNIVMIEYGGMT